MIIESKTQKNCIFTSKMNDLKKINKELIRNINWNYLHLLCYTNKVATYL